ncbi:hypothetical protein NBRC111894_782 [Sporolactobacillus inulinus]|nr:hypothetical protein [Sporolactobacillus inulinus]GAY75228.1 hypothetical protein NBRC111894_782 [Sporolactobacillus inulinus]
MGSLGVMIGAFLPSYGMAVLYSIVAVTGMGCFYQSLHRNQTVQGTPISREE